MSVSFAVQGRLAAMHWLQGALRSHFTFRRRHSSHAGLPSLASAVRGRSERCRSMEFTRLVMYADDAGVSSPKSGLSFASVSRPGNGVSLVWPGKNDDGGREGAAAWATWA